MNQNKKPTLGNYAFIDGQNLHMSTTKSRAHWHIDLKKFRVYLEQKYNVTKAFYFLGHVLDKPDIQELYTKVQEAGFILQFKPHSQQMTSKKKGNVDSDIIFTVMAMLYKRERFGKVVLVTGDGDYKSMVEFLISEGKFAKILFPNKSRSSSLYKKIGNQYFAGLDDAGIKAKIQSKEQKKVQKKEEAALGN